MRKLIEIAQQVSLVTCDNIKCNYTVPYTEEDDLSLYINKSCPNCGENLCTKEDYDDHIKFLKTVNFVNKWFSWLTIFRAKPKPEDYKIFEVHTHNGIKITKVEPENEKN